MDHEALKELVFLSHDRELSPSDQAEAETHLAQCPECRDALASWKRTSSLLFSSAKIDSPDHFVQKVMGRIEEGSLNPQTLLAGIRNALAPRRLVLAGTAALLLSALFLSRPFKTQNGPSDAAMEYASDLMEGPFAYADAEDATGKTAIEEFFL